MADTIYLDASAFVSLHVADASSARTRRSLGLASGAIIVSDLTVAEFAAAVARRHRMQALTKVEAAVSIRNAAAWVGLYANRVEMTALDLRRATAWIESLELPLRTPDAIHLAIAVRLQARLVTFDEQMTRCAVELGIDILRDQ